MAVESPRELDTNQILLALLALAVDERETRIQASDGSTERTELVLHAAGLGNAAIGQLLNKQPKLVAQTIRRARGREHKGGD
jgi:hypothetical protein